ncbi:MAG: hypothetical protein JWN74_1821 [Acidobacteriaceae bacterium]|nr:hypothetical protein [Acidobacteriaceae bacterium]
MTRDIRLREKLPAPDQKFLASIETFGWNVTNVFNKEGDTGPEWSYSTGLFHSYAHPEIIIFGLELRNMRKIVNNVGSAVKNGSRFKPGSEYFDIFTKYGCQFRDVSVDHYRAYLGWAIWFYERDSFPVLQCFWPDREGRYPWDPACSAAVVAQQPLLF